MAASRWDRSRDDRDQTDGRGPRGARSRWNPPASGYGEDSDDATPETGRWSARQDRWIPQPRSTDDTDYRIKRFVDDTGDMSIPPPRPGQGQILDHDEYWSTRRVNPAPPQPGDPYWGSSSSPHEPTEQEFGDPYWGAPQPAPPQPPRFIRRPPASGSRMSAPPMSPPAPPMSSPMSSPMSPPMSPPMPPVSRPRPAPLRPEPPRRPQPPPEPVWIPPEPAPPRFDDYRRTSDQTDWRRTSEENNWRGDRTDWRTGDYRWSGASGVQDDDYADWDAPDDDEDDEDESPRTRNYVYAALAALGWFIIPVAAYLGYAFLLNDQPPPGCNGASTPECLTPRAEALQNLFGNVPLVTITVSVSILIALVLRRVASGWRTLTVGFASAVVGAGAATVLFTVVSN